MIETIDMHRVATERIPEIRPYFDALYEKWGEVLPALYFGTSLVKLVQKLYHYSIAHPENQKVSMLISRILGVIEEFANDENPRILDIIGTGFVEGVWIVGEDYDAIIVMLGTTTQKMILGKERMDGGKPNLTEQELEDARSSHKYLDGIVRAIVEGL